MKNYVVQQGDTFASLSKQFNLKDEGILKTFHNLYCHAEDVMQEPVPGKTMIIPEDPAFLQEENTAQDSSPDSQQDTDTESSSNENKDNQAQNSPSENKVNKEVNEGNNPQSEDSSSPHDNKYFIVQKGTVQCNQGFTFPKFKVSSHQKHYWNDADGNADYLAVTEDDVQLDPTAQPFGQCKLRPTSGGYLPCVYAPAGKWQKTYEKVKVMDKNCLTEISELMCTTGGKITIQKHGQQSETSKSQVNNANTQEQQVYNPIVDFETFKENINDQPYYS